MEPLQKPEVKRVTAALTELEPWACEKREVYQHHSDVSAEVFERARQGRGNLSAVYEARSKFIHDQIAELKATNERRTREILNHLKQYSISFEENLSQRKKTWRSELRAGKDVLQKRGTFGDSELVRADSLIKEEHEETKRYTQAQVGPLLEQLEEHRQRLAATTAARGESHEIYCTALRQSFKKLREALVSESAARKQEIEETDAVARESYEDLRSKTGVIIEAIQEEMAEVGEKLKVEKADTSNSNTWITHEMMKFMAHFEGSVNESLEKQEVSKQYLVSLKTNFNPTT